MLPRLDIACLYAYNGAEKWETGERTGVIPYKGRIKDSVKEDGYEQFCV